MKDWQKGIPLEILLRLEATWKRYNERCLSPFLEMKKNKIAAAMDEGKYEYAMNGRYRVDDSRSKLKSICTLPMTYLLLQ